MRVAHVKPHKVFTLLTLVSVVCMSLSLFVSATHAAPNYQINYQGKLTDASNVAVANGTYNMRFWLLTSSSVATTSAIWTETLTGTSKVQVTNGLFSVMLGSTSPLTGVGFNQTLYLGVEIGGSGSPSWDGEMSPRKTLGAVPSAFEADRLDGLTSSQFVRTDATSSIATSSASTLLSLTQNGVGDIFNLFDGTTEVFTMTDGGRLGMGTTSPSRLFTMQGGDFYLGGNMTATGTLDVSGLTTLSSFIATNGTTTNATSTNLRVSSLFTLGSDAVSDLTGSGLINSSNALTCATANSSTFGCLTSADWTTFMDKVASSSIDTLAELETLTGVSNILIEGDLDASSELLALMDDETGTGNLVFSASPTFTGGAVFSGINTASSTLGYASTTALTIANRLFDTNNSAGTNGYILKSTGTSTLWVATSTLGFGTGSGSVTSVDLSVPTGFSVSGNPITTSGTLALSYAAGYEGLRTASSTNWNNFWDTPSTRISDGTGLTWSSNTLNCDTATAGAQGCVTAADWTTFMDKVASSSIDTSAELAALLTDETGTAGNLVFSTNPLLSGFRSNASSTIGDGTGAGGLTISGNGTTTGNAYFAGNVGIGTTAATGNLDISNANSPINIFTGGNATTSSGVELLRIASNYYGYTASSIKDSAAISIVSEGSGQAGIVFSTSPDGTQFRSTEKMRIAASGAITSNSTLALNGATTGYRTLAIGGDGVQISSGIDYTVASPNIYTDIYGAGMGGGWNGGIRFFTSANATAAERFRIDSTGNIGIGTTTPSRLLTVQGDGYFLNNITAASSTLGYASTTALTIANRLFDTNNSGGTNGYILKSTGTSTLWVATSTLGFGTGSGSVTSVDLSVPTGFSVSGNPITTSGTLALSYAAGYEGLRTASSTNWNNFWDTPSTRISDGAGLTWSSNTLNCDTATAGAPGCVTAADWTTFMDKVASSSIDTLAELEALQGSINIIQSTEIDTSSELAGILGDETGTGNAVFSTNPLLSGFRSNASSTIGDGTGAGGLTISGNGTTTGNAYFGGTLSLGSTTPESLGLTIDKAGLTGSVIAGIKERLQFTNSTLNAVYYGDNAYIVNAPTATSTLVAKMVRIQDDTSLGNTVRGIEAQAYRGTNTKGENTGLSGFGRTFGVRGTTIGDAGNTYLPAGVYAESQGSTQGNALRAYSGSLTTETLVSLFHDTSIFVGTGLEMNFGNAGGSFAATSSTAKFLDFQVGGTSKFIVAANGSTTIGDGTVSASLRIPYGGICVDNDGSCISTTTGQIRSVSSALGNSDLAEMYFSNQILQMGEIVSLTDGLSVARAGESEEENIIGVVSTKPGMTLGFDDTSLKIGETGYPIGLKGRVPVKLSTENGPIKKGDRITISSIPGIGMKATESSRVVGIALEDYDGTRAYSKGFLNQFGDDMVKERIVNKTIIDPKTQDGCYNGGGSALGEAGCAPDKVIQTAVTTTTDNTEYKDMLAALTNKPALSAETAEGESTTIGQVLMFIELGWYQSDTEKLVLAELTSTSTLLDGNGTDSIWSRIKELAQGFVDGVLTIAGIKADRVEVNDELCVDGVCVNADDLRAILNKAHEGSSVQGTSEGSGTQNPTPEVIEPAVENPALPTEFSSETTPISTDTGVVPEENALTEPSPVTENTVVQEQISEPTTIPETLVAEPGA